MPPERLRLTGESELETWESSPGVRRSFCRRCGTHVRYVSEQAPGRVYVPAGILAEPLDRAPDSHVNVRDAVSWHTVRDGLPCFDGFD